MLPYGSYLAISIGSVCVIILVGFIILLKLPLRRLVILLESVFRFKEVRNIGDDYAVIDVCNDQFEISKTISSRLPFIFALGMCFLVIILVFIEGCIFSTRHVYSTRLCSDRTPNCYLFKSQLTSFKPIYNFICEPDKPIIPSNMSASYAVCYGFVLPDQSSIDLLNQLGVCAGILSMVESLYPLAYRFARHKYRRICLILLICAMILLEIIILSMQLNVTFITIILLTLTEVLLVNIFVLQYRHVKYPANLTRVGSYIEMKDML
ncbi:unnamed protein product [Adineta steineri]|uniref:Uncharacterized protein n=1 Tax=Adineta steineri TaxID=433720 RepID=A0A815R0G2_9BILA|nr:unnamed protein product [Adineta steineri]